MPPGGVLPEPVAVSQVACPVPTFLDLEVWVVRRARDPRAALPQPAEFLMTPLSPGNRPGLRRRTLLTAFAPVLALVAACGGASSGGAVTPATAAATSEAAVTYPLTVQAANGAVTLKAQPKRIVSLSPTATEMLYAIGAGPQVIAVDSLSDYPAQAPRTKLSSFQPNAEAVVGYNPDLVVLSNDANGLLAALGKLGVPALLLPAAKDLPDSYTEEKALGAATGHPDGAAKVAQATSARVQAAVASVPASAKGLKVYHEIDQTYYSVTSSTFLGSIYAQFGLKDIADGAKSAASSGGYPQLSAEFVVTSAPDLIVLADSKCCGQSPLAVSKRPAFAGVPAVTGNRVIAIDDDIASRWGPRTADFAELVAKALGGK
jgi:iron complex transport system substrate-binding protein